MIFYIKFQTNYVLESFLVKTLNKKKGYTKPKYKPRTLLSKETSLKYKPESFCKLTISMFDSRDIKIKGVNSCTCSIVSV